MDTDLIKNKQSDIGDDTSFLSVITGENEFQFMMEGQTGTVTVDGLLHATLDNSEEGSLEAWVTEENGNIIIQGNVHAIEASAHDGRLYAHVYNLYGDDELGEHHSTVGMAYDASIHDEGGIGETLALTGDEVV